MCTCILEAIQSYISAFPKPNVSEIMLINVHVYVRSSRDISAFPTYIL